MLFEERYDLENPSRVDPLRRMPLTHVAVF